MDSDEIVLGRGVVADVTAAAEMVGLTIAEFFPRQVMHLYRLLRDFPLVHRRRHGSAGPGGAQSAEAGLFPTPAGPAPTAAP